VAIGMMFNDAGLTGAPVDEAKQAHAAIRTVCATMAKDRVMYQDFARIAELIASGKLAELVR